MKAKQQKRLVRQLSVLILLATIAGPTALAAAQVPTFSKEFNPSVIEPEEISTLSFTITNPSSTTVTSLSFTDILDEVPPLGQVMIANPSNAMTTCGGNINAPVDSDTLSFTGGSLGPGGTCVVSVDVTSDVLGTHPNTSSDLTSSAGNSGSASDDLHVGLCTTGRSPAFAVPSELWLDAFRPGNTGLANNRIPADRDSTDWVSLTPPGFEFGHELFQALDLLDDYLYVAYNAGIQVWDIGPGNEEIPDRIIVRDGWRGDFLFFQAHDQLPGEDDIVIDDIEVLRPASGGPNVYIAVSGNNPVGTTLWRFDTSTSEMTQLYQHKRTSSFQVALIEHDSRIYAFASGVSEFRVYDVTEAESQAPCLEEAPGDCPGVFLGGLGTISRGGFVDVLQRPSGEILVANSNGANSSLGLELWRLTDPSNPGSATRLFTGLDNLTFGVTLFDLDGHDYLGAVERAGSNIVIRIFQIDQCTGTGTCSLGAATTYSAANLPSSDSRQFLTYSTSEGTPFLYYGVGSASLGGAKRELLLNLSGLGQGGQITEITDGGPTYLDYCVSPQGAPLDYWPYYYSANQFGFQNMQPQIGKFNPDNGFFYRAAYSILDVHIWDGGGAQIPSTTTTVSDPDPQGLYWMGDQITFAGNGGNGCNPVGTWTWDAQSASTEVDAVLVNQVGNEVTYRFECIAGSGRCADAAFSVSGTNSDASCAGATTTAANVPVKDPSLEITSIIPNGGTYTHCEIVTFDAELLGRGPTDYAWTVEAIEMETGTATEEDLSTSALSFDWDTSTATLEVIFLDGFETGDTSRWDTWQGRGTPGSLFDIGLGLDGGSTTESVTVEVIPVDGDPTFDVPEITSSTTDNTTFDFQANTVSATVTEWTWELQDDSSSVGCTFDNTLNCVTKLGRHITHTWVGQAGERRVDVRIENCVSALMDQATTMVTVLPGDIGLRAD